MMSVNSAHARESQPLGDGTWRALTLINRGEHGVLVWAGRLRADALRLEADDVVSTDYVQRETVSFMSWDDAIDYFRGREFEPLLAEALATARRRDAVSRPY